MSIASHRKKDSDELDVFEAAQYFSGANEIGPGPENCRFNFSQKFGPGKKSASRRSLDMPIIITNPTGNSTLDRKKSNENKKSYKQPSSPGGKLIANFINSIFNQTASKKKKKSGQNGETDQSPGESRRRRSSISHLRIITNNNHDSRLPDFYAKTPTKSSYKDLFRKNPVSGPGNVEDLAAERRRAADEIIKSRFGSRDFGLSGRNNNPTATVNDDDDSDSSSDLFDLPINGPQLDFYSYGLPVYGTTRVV